MASGTAGEATNVYSLRIRWSSTYHPQGNYSIVNVYPQEKGGANFGGEMLGTGYGLSGNGGLYINGSQVYELDGSYGGSNNNFSRSASDSWGDFDPTTGGYDSITVYHNSSGVASFTARVYANVFPYYYPTTDSYKHKIDTGTVTITITESAPYTLNYSANGGSGVPGSQSVYYGSSYTVNPSGTIPTRTGYRFLGWSTNSSATTASYSNGSSITVYGNTTLYAIWQKLSYTLTISGDAHSIISVTRGGTPLSNGATIYYGDVLSISISASTGYQVESRSPAANTVTVTGNVTVSATTSPMATIHRRIGGAWGLYLIYVRESGSWNLHQANIRKTGLWSKYY